MRTKELEDLLDLLECHIKEGNSIIRMLKEATGEKQLDSADVNCRFEPDTKLEPDTEPELDTELKPDAEPESDTKLELDAEPESDTELGPDTESGSDTEPVEPEADPQSGFKMNVETINIQASDETVRRFLELFK